MQQYVSFESHRQYGTSMSGLNTSITGAGSPHLILSERVCLLIVDLSAHATKPSLASFWLDNSPTPKDTITFYMEEKKKESLHLKLSRKLVNFKLQLL